MFADQILPWKGETQDVVELSMGKAVIWNFETEKEASSLRETAAILYVFSLWVFSFYGKYISILTIY